MVAWKVCWATDSYPQSLQFAYTMLLHAGQCSRDCKLTSGKKRARFDQSDCFFHEPRDDNEGGRVSVQWRHAHEDDDTVTTAGAYLYHVTHSGGTLSSCRRGRGPGCSLWADRLMWAGCAMADGPAIAAMKEQVHAQCGCCVHTVHQVRKTATWWLNYGGRLENGHWIRYSRQQESVQTLWSTSTEVPVLDTKTNMSSSTILLRR